MADWLEARFMSCERWTELKYQQANNSDVHYDFDSATKGNFLPGYFPPV